MNKFPAEALTQYGALNGLRDFCVYAQRPLVVVSAKWFSVGNEACFTEYGHLKVDTSRYATAAWDYLNPGMILNAAMTEKLGIPEQSLNAGRSMDHYSQALKTSLKGANVVVDDIRLDLEVFRKLIEGAEDVILIKASSMLKEENKSFHDDSAGQASPSPCYDRCMLIANSVQTELFLQGAKHINGIFKGAAETPALLDERLQHDQGTDKRHSLTTAQPKKKQSSLEASLTQTIESGKIFPVWSLEYLKGKLDKDGEHGDVLVKASVDDLDYVLSNLLKNGLFHPSKILHKDLFEKMEPHLLAAKEDDKAKLRNVKSTLEKQIGKTLDFTLVRAGLMKVGHPAYRVTPKEATTKPKPNNCKL